MPTVKMIRNSRRGSRTVWWVAWANDLASVTDAQQIIVQKQKLDAFSNPTLRPLLGVLKADRYVLYGVVTELCVSWAAYGLLESGARVELVTDAIKSLSQSEERNFLDRFRAGGGQLTTSGAVRA